MGSFSEDQGRPHAALSAIGRAFLLFLPECPRISERQSREGVARTAAGQARGNRVERVKIGRNRALARGRNRFSRAEPTRSGACRLPRACPDGRRKLMLGSCQAGRERACPSNALLADVKPVRRTPTYLGLVGTGFYSTSPMGSPSGVWSV